MPVDWKLFLVGRWDEPLSYFQTYEPEYLQASLFARAVMSLADAERSGRWDRQLVRRSVQLQRQIPHDQDEGNRIL